MNLLITFFVMVTISVIGSAWLGVLVDRMTSPFISLVVFFPMMALAIWLSWRLAVKFTEPKSTPSA